MLKSKIRAIFSGCMLFLVLFIVSCNKQGDNPVDPTGGSEYYRGEIVGEPKFWTEAPTDFVKNIADAFNINSDYIGKYSVRVYSMTYKTIDKNGDFVNASGTVFYPVSNEELPVLSYHHGTEFYRMDVASINPFANQAEAFLIASNGYATFVPDYLGYGVSNRIHPYHVADISANTAIDFIRAGKSFCKDHEVKLNNKLFLGGYSEGGYVTLAVQKEIETNLASEFSVTASAPLSGAYDLMETGKYYFNKEVVSRPDFLGFLITAYNDVYEWNKLDTIFNQPYAAKMNSLYDGSHSSDDIKSNLNDTLNVLIKQEFIDKFLSSETTAEKQKFAANSLLDWTPKAPIQMVHGDSDEIVPYINASKAYDTFKAKGADVVLMTVPGGTHATTIIPAVVYTLDFFKKYK
ncbi:MAG: alpha/beta hydrolase family protein [Rhodothermaceae bacterium]